METTSYCAACGHWQRRAATVHLYNVVSTPVKVDIEHLDAERCDHCRKTFVSRAALKATLRQLVHRVADHDPSLPRVTIRRIAEQVARALNVGVRRASP